MSSQCYVPPQTDDKDSKKAEEESNAQWRMQKMLASAMGGNSTGRVLDWRTMPRLSIWR